MLRLPYEPVRQIAKDPTIGNVVAAAGLLALVLQQHLDGKPDCPSRYGPAGFAGQRPLCAAL
jgi:hypothetical protein